MASLHSEIKKKAINGWLVLSELKPNSREVAKRMIEKGELVQTAKGDWIWHDKTGRTS